MAVKNLQTVETRVALRCDQRATGLECNVSMQAIEVRPASILSLPWHPLPGPMPTIRTERSFAADNAATARAVQRAGRSERGAGVKRTGLARSASRTVLSTRSTSMRSYQGYSYAIKTCGLTKRMTNQVRG